MELSSQESIRALMRGYENQINPTRVRHRRGAPDTVRPAGRDRRVRCRCGRCGKCLENARWERIFAEKFADPNYYTGPVVRCSSPLMSL